MNTAAIIQARTGARRLPNKVLLDLEGKSVLERVIERVKSSKRLERVVVATTTLPEDLRIADLCSGLEVEVFRGSENDVLDRYYQAASRIKAENIVRITADCPLIDPRLIDEAVELHLKEKADYTSNTLKESYPDGEDVEVFTFAALERAWKEARLASEREHVTPYMRKNPEVFKLAGLESKVDLSQKRWTLDNQEDYEFLKIIYRNMGDKLFGIAEVLSFLKEHPEAEELNRHIRRNEGYTRSLKEEAFKRNAEDR